MINNFNKFNSNLEMILWNYLDDNDKRNFSITSKKDLRIRVDAERIQERDVWLKIHQFLIPFFNSNPQLDNQMQILKGISTDEKEGWSQLATPFSFGCSLKKIKQINYDLNTKFALFLQQNELFKYLLNAIEYKFNTSIGFLINIVDRVDRISLERIDKILILAKSKNEEINLLINNSFESVIEDDERTKKLKILMRSYRKHQFDRGHVKEMTPLFLRMKEKKQEELQQTEEWEAKETIKKCVSRIDFILLESIGLAIDEMLDDREFQKAEVLTSNLSSSEQEDYLTYIYLEQINKLNLNNDEKEIIYQKIENLIKNSPRLCAGFSNLENPQKENKVKIVSRISSTSLKRYHPAFVNILKIILKIKGLSKTGEYFQFLNDKANGWFTKFFFEEICYIWIEKHAEQTNIDKKKLEDLFNRKDPELISFTHQTYEQMLDLFPYCFFKKGFMDEAFYCLPKIKSVDMWCGEYDKVVYAQCFSYVKNKEYDKALDLTKTLLHPALLASTYEMIIEALMDRGEVNEALAYFEKSQEYINNEDLMIAGSFALEPPRGLIFGFLKEKKILEALEILKKLLKDDLINIRISVEVAIFFLGHPEIEKNFELAIRCIEDGFIPADSSFSQVFKKIGSLLVHLKEKEGLENVIHFVETQTKKSEIRSSIFYHLALKLLDKNESTLLIERCDQPTKDLFFLYKTKDCIYKSDFFEASQWLEKVVDRGSIKFNQLNHFLVQYND